MVKGVSISLIAAVAENGVIGCDGKLPWHLPADLAHFKQITLDHSILMGRRTWESLPGLLPRRQHLILSRNPQLQIQSSGAIKVSSLEAALTVTGDNSELMVIGGAEIFALTLPYASKFYLTQVLIKAIGNIYFPTWEPSQWRVIKRIDYPPDPKNSIGLRFLELIRLPKAFAC